MGTIPQEVIDVLEVEFPTTCDLAELIKVETVVNDLWYLLRTDKEAYPKLFALGRDTWRMRRNREAALRVLDWYLDKMDPTHHRQEPQYKKALSKWSKNTPRYLPGTLPRVLSYASAFAANKSWTRFGDIFFFCNKWRMRWELSILKQNLREYFFVS